MSFFKQQKLLKSEWISLERKLDAQDINILKIVQDGYHDYNICHDFHKTIRYILKINDALDDIYIFNTCFGEKYNKIVKKSKFNLFQHISLKENIKKAKKSDIIRIENTLKSQKDIIDRSIESIILNIIFRYMKKSEDTDFWVLSLYNIISKNPHLRMNRIVSRDVIMHLRSFSKRI